MKLIFTIERTAEYTGDDIERDDLLQHRYIVSLSNGDSHLLDTVEDIEALVSSELFLHGYADDAR